MEKSRFEGQNRKEDKVHVEIAMLMGKDWEVGGRIHETDHWKGGSEAQRLKLDK